MPADMPAAGPNAKPYAMIGSIDAGVTVPPYGILKSGMYDSRKLAATHSAPMDNSLAEKLFFRMISISAPRIMSAATDIHALTGISPSFSATDPNQSDIKKPPCLEGYTNDAYFAFPTQVLSCTGSKGLRLIGLSAMCSPSFYSITSYYIMNSILSQSQKEENI
jgi:hypothetical protein